MTSGETKIYTDEELLDILRRAADEIDGKVTQRKFQSWDGPTSPSTFYRRFGSWNNAKAKVGLDHSYTGGETAFDYSYDQHFEWSTQIKESVGCYACDETNPVTLQFHHIDPDTKENRVGQMIREHYSFAEIAEEISKCAVLCANCHKRLHYGDLEPPTETVSPMKYIDMNP